MHMCSQEIWCLVDMITAGWSFIDSLQTLETNSNWITNESKKSEQKNSGNGVRTMKNEPVDGERNKLQGTK